MPDYAPDVVLTDEDREALCICAANALASDDREAIDRCDAHLEDVERIIAARVAEAERRGGVRALRDAADELDRRAFGGTAARVVRERADRLAEGGDQ